MTDESARIRRLRDKLWQGLQSLGSVHRHGSAEHSIPGILNVSFEAIAGEALLLDLYDDVAVSSGSACTSATQEPSHVLKAMGVSDQLADSALRFSVGRFTTDAEIDHVLNTVQRSVRRLRAISPLWIC